jgi:hypothetical protein
MGFGRFGRRMGSGSKHELEAEEVAVAAGADGRGFSDWEREEGRKSGG